ncbi:MAG: CHASE2 domain-containing protein [Bacteroides sp.]|nr:CHASE2 domain-containing protein [Bacteroides sp.]
MTTKNYLKCAVSVLIAFILSLFLTSDVTSDLIIGLIGGNADFEVSDFYNRVDASKLEKSFNSDIIVVNIDNVETRDSIAIIIDQIAASDPAVIGVDILFRNPKESIGDSLLINSFRSNKEKIVTAIALYGNGEENFTYVDDNIFLENMPAYALGVANLAALPGGIVRSFLPYFQTSTGTLPAFATSIVSRYSPDYKEKMFKKGSDEMKLRYSNEKFLCIPPELLYSGEYDLKDKIVLVGTLNDPVDMHSTPVDAAYPGVLIQAHIISTMLKENYISTAGGLLNKIIAILISFLLCMIYVRYDSNNAQNIILRFMLITVMAAGIFIGCVLYCKFNIYINIAMILLVIALSQFVLDIWYGIEEIASRLNKSTQRNKNIAALVFLIISFGYVENATAEDIYTVHDIEGTVTRLKSGLVLSRGSKIEGEEMLGMERNRVLTISDKSTGKLYISKSQENTTPECIIKVAKSQSKSIMKRMYSEMLSNIKRRDNRMNASTGSNIGAVVRDDGEELNANTEYIFSFLSSLLSSNDILEETNLDSKIIELTAHEISDDVIWWSICNNSSIPLYVNILQLSDGNTPHAFIYESDVEMPSLLIAPGKELNLCDQLFLCTHRKYILVASKFPFDTQDINMFFADGEKPLPLNELGVKKDCIVTSQISF